MAGFSSARGYQLFKGARKHSFAVGMVVCFSTLAVLGSCAICTLAAFSREPEVRHVAMAQGIPVLQLAWSIMLENIPLLLLNFALPLVVSGLGIALSRKKLSAYTQPEKVQHAAQAAEQVLNQADGTKVYFPNIKLLKGFQQTNILFLAPIFIMLFGIIVLATIDSDLLDSIAAFIAALLVALVILLAYMIHVLKVQSSLEYCLVRDGQGRLWRARLLHLNRIPTYQFGYYTGLMTVNINTHSAEQKTVAEAAVLRAVEAVSSGSLQPGSPVLNAVTQLTDFKLGQEGRWTWKGSYTASNGSRKGLIIAKVYPGFHPLDDREAQLPAKVQPMALVVGLALLIAVLAVFILLSKLF